jgi:hypothetical protein
VAHLRLNHKFAAPYHVWCAQADLGVQNTLNLASGLLSR